MASSSSLSREELAERVRSIELDRDCFTEAEEGVSVFAVGLLTRDATLERVLTGGCPTDGVNSLGAEALCPPTIVPMRLVFLRLVDVLTLGVGILCESEVDGLSVPRTLLSRELLTVLVPLLGVVTGVFTGAGATALL